MYVFCPYAPSNRELAIRNLDLIRSCPTYDAMREGREDLI